MGDSILAIFGNHLVLTSRPFDIPQGGITLSEVRESS